MPESKEKTEEDRPRGQKRVKSFPSKVVIRKLPPSLTQEAFIETISPLPELHDFYFVKADWSLGAEATSRAYLEFKNEEDIFIFRDKFDSYIFVDSVRGSEYPAIVEYASFQGLPKSRARKKDKHVSTIEIEQHFISFLEQLKAEEDETQKFEPKVSVEYSYQLKDDKKITSTPLIEFLSQKKEEKRDARRKKQDDKRKQRDDEKQKKKAQVAKNVPEPIKELKEEPVYEDGIMVRTVPSRLGRNERGGGGAGDRDRKKDSKPEPKSDAKSESKQKSDDAKKEARKKAQKEKEEKKRAERSLQRAKEYEKKKLGLDGAEPSTSKESGESRREPVEPREPKEKKEASAKPETKRYSALRKARQEKVSDAKEPSEFQEVQDEVASADAPAEGDKKSEPAEKKAEPANKRAEWDEAKKAAREKRAEENRERRAREADERAQRQIKNKDRPTLQIYQPKRRQDNESKGDNLKSSDETSETSRKKSDSDRRGDRRERRGPPRKNSRDETSRRKKNSRKNSDETGKEAAGDVGKVKEEAAGDVKANEAAGDGVKAKDDVLTEKLKKLALESPKKSPEVVETKSEE